MKKLIADKEKDILRERSEYFRLVEQFKFQIKDKQTLVESLTNEDAKCMKLMLQLQNQINESEKNAERSLHDAQIEKETEIAKIKKEGQTKLEEGDVQISEVKEDNNAQEAIFREMSIYEIQVFEWGAQCSDLQQKISQVKY